MSEVENFDAILDIGANEGVFSLYARFLQPKAYIIAIEPCTQTYSNLVENLSYLENFSYRRAALGKDGFIYLDI